MYKLTFKRWLCDRYVDKHTPMGDFARDVANDLDFPYSSSLPEVWAYLEAQHPCDACVEVFRKAWRLYTTWLMKELMI